MNSSYFENPTDSLQHNGKEVGILKKGDTQTTVNEKMAAELDYLKALVLSQSRNIEQQSSGNIINDSGFGSDKSEVDSGERLTVKVEPKDDSIYVSYEYLLPEGSERVNSNASVEGIRNGVKTVLIDSNKLINGFYLQPASFPATLSFDVNVNRNGQQERLSAKVQLQPSGDDTKYTLYKRIINASNLTTQKDVNEYLYRELNRLNKVTEEKKVSVNGVEKSMVEAFVELNVQISELKKEIEILKSNSTGSIV
jgi:hypothetical protein